MSDALQLVLVRQVMRDPAQRVTIL